MDTRPGGRNHLSAGVGPHYGLGPAAGHSKRCPACSAGALHVQRRVVCNYCSLQLPVEIFLGGDISAKSAEVRVL